MSNVKMKTIGKFYCSAIWIISITLLVDAARVKLKDTSYCLPESNKKQLDHISSDKISEHFNDDQAGDPENVPSSGISYFHENETDKVSDQLNTNNICVDTDIETNNSINIKTTKNGSQLNSSTTINSCKFWKKKILDNYKFVDEIDTPKTVNVTELSSSSNQFTNKNVKTSDSAFQLDGKSNVHVTIEVEEHDVAQDCNGTNVVVPGIVNTAITEHLIARAVITQLVITEPVITEPVITEPVITEPVITKPVITEPVVTEPVVTEPVVTEPVVTEPVVTEPVVTEPVVTEPVVTEPVVTEPVTTEPVIAKDVTTESKITEAEAFEPEIITNITNCEPLFADQPLFSKQPLNTNFPFIVEQQLNIDLPLIFDERMITEQPIYTDHSISTDQSIFIEQPFSTAPMIPEPMFNIEDYLELPVFGMDLNLAYSDVLYMPNKDDTEQEKNVEYQNALLLNESDFELHNQFYGTLDSFDALKNVQLVSNPGGELVHKSFEHETTTLANVVEFLKSQENADIASEITYVLKPYDDGSVEVDVNYESQSDVIHSQMISSKQPSSPFKDFKVETVVHPEDQTALRLRITWNPNTTNESKFTVIVSPIDASKLCPDKGCSSWYGQTSDNSTLFVPLEKPNHDSCEILPGCSYRVMVESESDNFESEITYRVPDNVGNLHSCHHKIYEPDVRTSATIDSEIMTIRWNISGNDSVPSDKTYFIIVIITEANKDLNKKLHVFNQTLDNPSQQSGEFKWNVPSNGIKYLTRTFVYDSHNCGPGYPLSRAYGKPLEEPLGKPIGKPQPQDNNEDPSKIHIKWLMIAVLSFVIIVLIATLIIFKAKEERPTNNQMHGAPPEKSVITIFMKDNPTYDILDEIPHANIQLIKKIGEGAFGTVFFARGKNICGKPGFQNVAVKQLKKRPTEEQKEEFFGEIQTMKTVSRHPNIVALFGFCTLREPLQIVMEYVGCGDLKAYLHKLRARHEERYGRNRVSIPCEPNHPLIAPPSGRYLDLMNSSTTSTSDSSHATETEGTILRPSVTETMYTTLSINDDMNSTSSSLEYVLDHKELHIFARQIAEGMKHLHDMKITHRDLAARNILIDEHKTLKISDFGLSRSGIYVNTKNKAVPLRWLSIEAMRDNLYSDKSDVWAFGIVLWEIGALGGHPYHTVTNYDLSSYLSAGNRLERPDNCSTYLYELMQHCWAARPDDRPDFIQILSKLELHQRIYVDFSEISSDYVFPPTKEQIQNNKSSNGLRLRNLD